MMGVLVDDGSAIALVVLLEVEGVMVVVAAVVVVVVGASEAMSATSVWFVMVWRVRARVDRVGKALFVDQTG